MTGVNIIKSIRIATFDDKVDSQTWKDDKYLDALNQARKYLFTNHPESRLNSGGTLQTYSDIEEQDLSNTMYEADDYATFLVEYVCYLYFGSTPGDTLNSTAATAHYTAALRALDPRNRTFAAMGR